MENINIEHLTQVAKYKEIGEAFGVTHQAVARWVKNGEIPTSQRDNYDKSRPPLDKQKALNLYKRALKQMRLNNEN